MRKTRRIEVMFEILRIMAAVMIAYLLAMAVLFLISEEPMKAIRSFALGPISTKRRFSSVIELMIPFMFTGICMCMMYSANRFNLAGEGIFLFSGCIITFCAFQLEPLGLPRGIFPFVLIVTGGLVGGVIALIPAYAREKFKVNEVVVSIMLNYALLYFSNYILRNFMLDTSVTYSASYELPEAAKLLRIWPGTRLHTGVFIAAVAVIGSYIFLYKTPRGYCIRTSGLNVNFAGYIGVNVMASCLIAQLLGGFFAGAGGAVQILGLYDRFQWDNLTQYGFDGLLVSVLAKRNPALVPIAAFMLAYLRIGADIVNYVTDVPAEFISVLQAIIILLVAAQSFLGPLRDKVIYNTEKKNLSANP